jgi:hypothetical protein
MLPLSWFKLVLWCRGCSALFQAHISSSSSHQHQRAINLSAQIRAGQSLPLPPQPSPPLLPRTKPQPLSAAEAAREQIGLRLAVAAGQVDMASKIRKTVGVAPTVDTQPFPKLSAELPMTLVRKRDGVSH